MAVNRGFITTSNFTEQAQLIREESRIYKWTELKEGEIFKIISSEETEGQYGISFILTIVNEEETIKRIWTPKRLADKFNANKTKTTYFTSLGQIFQDNKRINDFDVVIVE